MLKILLARGEVASKANDDWQKGVEKEAPGRGKLQK
jgi:hypothetical protein